MGRSSTGVFRLPSLPVDKADRRVIDHIRAGLQAAGDRDRAASQQAYMKSTMPYAGVTVPVLRRLTRAAPALAGADAWHDTVLTLWREATVREERYAAHELTTMTAYRPFSRSLDALPMYEEMIVDGAWWDHVDSVAVHSVGPLVLDQPEILGPVMRAWSVDPDRWRRRTSIICQVGAGAKLDTDLLGACIVPNLDDRDFFLRKGIGWALRQHARVDPDWVRAFAESHPLSPLSRREALRHIGAA
jgi:3-methyladenine DNA glycosylase AlkD